MQAPVRLHLTPGAKIAGDVVGARVGRISVHRDLEVGGVLVGRALRGQQSGNAHPRRVDRPFGNDPGFGRCGPDDGAAVRVVSVLFTTDEFLVNRLTRQLGQVKAFLEKEGVECTAEIIKSIKSNETLAQNILEYATQVDGDLIMIMTQQEVDFTKYFIGSAAQEIIHHSTIPVMSITPIERKDTTLFANPY